MKNWSPEECIKALIQLNFIEMIKHKDIILLKTLKDDNNNSLGNLLLAIGANQDILKCPAHREQLEELLKEILEELIESLQNGRDDVGYEVEFGEYNNLKVRSESFATQDEYELKIDENEYSFKHSSRRTGLGYSSKEIQGNLVKKQILSYEQIDGIGKSAEKATKLNIDDLGFVTEQSTVIKSKDDKKVSKIFRKGSQVSTKRGTCITWNADPLHLNAEEVLPEESYKKAIRIVSKYPNTQKYYESVLGISLDGVLKEGKTD